MRIKSKILVLKTGKCGKISSLITESCSELYYEKACSSFSNVFVNCLISNIRCKSENYSDNFYYSFIAHDIC